MNAKTLTALALVGVFGLAGCGQGASSSGPQPEATPTAAVSTSGSPAVSATSEVDQARLDEQLRAAAWKNDLPTARRLIRQGADVNAKDGTQQSAYLIATSEGYLDLLRLTLRHGADVKDLDSWKGTGLIRAAERGHALVVGRLLQAGIDRNHVNRIGYQAIHEAVWLGEDDSDYRTTVRVLYAGGAQFDRPSVREGLTPLQMAGRRGYDHIERSIRTMTNDSVNHANAVLLQAAAAGDADQVAAAIRAGADLEARDSHRRTALLLAVTHDHVDAAKVLVAMGASPDALDDRHDTPWLVTGVTGSVPMLEALLPARPDMSIPNRYGGLSVIPASERGHVDYVRRVVGTGIDVNHVNDLGWTALLEAVILGDGGPAHQEIVKILLAHGANRSVADKDGVTALQHAERQSFDEIAALLG